MVATAAADVRRYRPRVTAVQLRTRCGQIRADLAAIGPKAAPRKRFGVSDRCALQFLTWPLRSIRPPRASSMRAEPVRPSGTETAPALIVAASLACASHLGGDCLRPPCLCYLCKHVQMLRGSSRSRVAGRP